MRWTMALIGDVMLGRTVADRLEREPHASLVDGTTIEVLRSADITLANLECCISERGERWPDPRKPFFFRAPPVAARHLADWGVDAVTLANNHALDYGASALIDTLRHLADAGVVPVGAGADMTSSRIPLRLTVGASSLGVVAFSDHPADFAAGESRPGIAYADLRSGDASWVIDTVEASDTDVTVVTPHWGPNMVPTPVPQVRAAAVGIAEAGAALIAGHSAHVFHGAGMVSGCPVLFDLGDFLDDYRVDRQLRNDLGLVWTVMFDDAVPVGIDAYPVALEFCATRRATPAEFREIATRLRRACAEFRTGVEPDGDRLVLHPAGLGG